MRPLALLTHDSPRRQKLSTFISAAYAWIAIVAFGAIAVETVVIYPNVFGDVPGSLDKTVEFFSVTGPADLFRPLGAAALATCVAALAVCWPIRRARRWIGSALITWVFGDFLFSVLYFWPRNNIMFEEGAAVHSAETLTRVAVEFETGHWGRLAMSAVTATLAFVGMWHCLRYRVAATMRTASRGNEA